MEEGAGKRCSECDQYPNLSEGADRVGGQLRGGKECPFRDVTNSGRIWRKMPKSWEYDEDCEFFPYRHLRSGCRESAVSLFGLMDNLFGALANQYQSCVVRSTGRLNTWGKRYCVQSSGGKRLKYKGKRYFLHFSGGKRLKYKGERYFLHFSGGKRLKYKGERYFLHSSDGKRLKYKGERYFLHSSDGKRLKYKGKRYFLHSSGGKR